MCTAKHSLLNEAQRKTQLILDHSDSSIVEIFHINVGLLYTINSKILVLA